MQMQMMKHPKCGAFVFLYDQTSVTIMHHNVVPFMSSNSIIENKVGLKFFTVMVF